MKNTATVFLTSIAVSAISLATPLPTAATILNLFLGEEIAILETEQTECNDRQHANPEAEGENEETQRKLPEQQDLVKDHFNAAFSLINTISLDFGKETC
jgi:uncharacterized membrane-anchored protein YhcB (DUF1043 family)